MSALPGPVQWERGYAERSGVTVEQLREWGCVVATCDCAWDGCEGLQSISGELLESYQAMGRLWVQLVPHAPARDGAAT